MNVLGKQFFSLLYNAVWREEWNKQSGSISCPHYPIDKTWKKNSRKIFLLSMERKTSEQITKP